jgi:hypothetical protein
MVNPLCENNTSTGTEVIGIQKYFWPYLLKVENGFD